jgi:hypothetical protein
MTTAARPTWVPAKGGHEQGRVRMFGPSQKFSSRDLASHTALKLRFSLPRFASHASSLMSVCKSPFCMCVCLGVMERGVHVSCSWNCLLLVLGGGIT